MEWLWLLLSIIGLGLIWLLIIGIERLTDRLKEHDEMRRIETKRIAARTAEAEADFIAKDSAKATAKDYIEHAENFDKDDPQFQAALDNLTSEELVQTVAKRVFGTPKGTKEIMATKSAFDQNPVRKVIAKGDGVMPVKVKSSGKSALSKSEQKMLKKIKQGD